MNKKMTSAILFIIVSVIMSIVFSFLLLTARGVRVNIDPKIYSTNNNIGVLNEEGSFVFSITNGNNHSGKITILITTEISTLVNTTITIDPKSAKTETITQKLIYTGTWIVEVLSEDQKILNSYSFVTVTNSVEAEMQINALKNIQETKNLANISNIIALLSLGISIAALIVSVSRKKQEEK